MFDNPDWILYALGAYVVITVAIYLFQEKFFFHPEKLSPDFIFKYGDAFKEVEFEIDEKTKIHGLHFYSEYPVGIVLYFHGNTRSVKGWGKYAADFLKNYHDVVMIDYRGFGKSTGKRSEKTLFSDAQLVYEKIKEKFPEEQIVVYGRSMGSGIAAKIASENNPSKLILHAPYYSFLNISKKYVPFLPVGIILRFHLRTDKYLRVVNCPTYIIHGTRDRVIPYSSSAKLKKIDPSRIFLLPIINGKHKNLTNFPIYHTYLEKVLNGTFNNKPNVYLDPEDLDELTQRNH